MQDDPEHLLSVALAAAKKAAKVVSNAFTSKISIETKSSYHDVLTEIDLQSEKIIIKHILENYKDHAILSEESINEAHQEGQIYWIIDPIDGTWNYAHKIPQFCISIAAARDQEILAAVIYAPIVDEVYTASKGSGAFLNKQKLQIKEPESLYHSCISVKILEHIDTSRSFGIIRRSGSTALDLAYIAASRITALVETSIQPWDVAAGTLLIQEAGGVVTTFENNPLIVDQKSSILAAPQNIHKDLVKLINLAL
jgi:myo-inositol-1(or 4)-monophosphatase